MTSGEMLAQKIRKILGHNNDSDKSVGELVAKICRENKQLKQRELELMAQVERLRDVIQDYAPLGFDAVQVALRVAPQQSLAEHDAEVVLKFAARLLSNHKIDVIDEAKLDANKLRQQAYHTHYFTGLAESIEATSSSRQGADKE